MSLRDFLKLTPRSEVTAIARDNPFKSIAQGLKSSVERLPGPMVIILVLALAVSLSLGIIMKISSHFSQKDVYLPLRLSVDAEKKAIMPEQLRGTWVYNDQTQSMSIRFGVDVFEIMQRRAGETYIRYYVRGGYRTEGNILILQIREDLGSPFEPTQPLLKFIPMEFDQLNIDVELSDKLMLWRIPSSERKYIPLSAQDDFPLTDERPMPFIRISRS